MPHTKPLSAAKDSLLSHEGCTGALAERLVFFILAASCQPVPAKKPQSIMLWLIKGFAEIFDCVYFQLPMGRVLLGGVMVN